MSSQNFQSPFELMRSLKWYCDQDPYLVKLRTETYILIQEFNQTTEDSKFQLRRKEIFNTLFKEFGENLCIMPPFYCDYGKFISFGKNVYMNFNCMILDGSDVKIGNNIMFGPSCHIYTVLHPLDPEERNKSLQIHKKVEIGDNVWIGGGVIILPGVKIGNNCVIGAGSIVTKSIEDNCLAFGNPCKVIREIKKETKNISKL